MTHLNQRDAIHPRGISSGTGRKKPSISLGMMIAVAGLVLALASLYGDCFGPAVKALILVFTAGSLVTLAVVYVLYRLEAHTHPHIVNPLIALLIGTVVVLVFQLGGCGKSNQRQTTVEQAKQSKGE